MLVFSFVPSDMETILNELKVVFKYVLISIVVTFVHVGFKTFFPEIYEALIPSKPVGRWIIIVGPTLLFLLFSNIYFGKIKRLEGTSSVEQKIDAYGGLLISSGAVVGWPIILYIIFYD